MVPARSTSRVDGLGKNLHATTKSKNQVKNRFFRNILVTQTTAIFQLHPVKDKTLLI